MKRLPIELYGELRTAYEHHAILKPRMTYDSIFFKIVNYPTDDTIKALTHHITTHYRTKRVYQYPDYTIQVLLFAYDAESIRALFD